MTAVVLGLLLVPLLDHAIKRAVRGRLDAGTISLGPLGELRAVHARIWMARASRGVRLPAVWAVWIVAASVLATFSAVTPSLGWCSGLLLGGSLSHALETSVRGSVFDYVCLRFWPAFDLADVALAAGALGMVVEGYLWVHPG